MLHESLNLLNLNTAATSQIDLFERLLRCTLKSVTQNYNVQQTGYRGIGRALGHTIMIIHVVSTHTLVNKQYLYFLRYKPKLDHKLFITSRKMKR